MTSDPHRSTLGGPGNTIQHDDVLASLWEAVPFPRLPSDAPPELKEIVIKVENPKRIYAIHRASRRHNLQLLVERFTRQLRFGCGFQGCVTSSCFSCRRRLAGDAPIRRYSPASARTLAVYMTGLDNPEARLCPRLRSAVLLSDTIDALAFGPKSQGPTNDGRRRKTVWLVEEGRESKIHMPFTGAEVRQRNAQPTSVISVKYTKDGKQIERDLCKTAGFRSSPPNTKGSAVNSNELFEKAARKDYRSFAANVFGTAAFKMLEWLTPASFEGLSLKAESARNLSLTEGKTSIEIPTAGESADSYFLSMGSSSVDLKEKKSEPVSQASDGMRELSEKLKQDSDVFTDSDTLAASDSKSTTSRNSRSRERPLNSRRNSTTQVRSSTITKPSQKLPVDHQQKVKPTENLSARVSACTSPSRSEEPAKALSHGTSSPASRRSSNDDDSEHSFLKDRPKRAEKDSRTDVSVPQSAGASDEALSSCETVASAEPRLESIDRTPEDRTLPDFDSELDDLLPQSLSTLNMQVINLICDVLRDDCTAETVLLEPLAISGPVRRSSLISPFLIRKQTTQGQSPRNSKLEWRLFIEQSIFTVLSDPRAILASFAGSQGLLDSQSLWYGMWRMTRVAPSLVFDSLWHASSTLFAPPSILRSSRSPMLKSFPKQDTCLTNQEAGYVLAVCLHALMAAVPLVTDSRVLFDMSRMRSRGLTLAESGAVSRQPSSLCLQYEDAFSDSLALRLARRLMASIPVRRYFDELAQNHLSLEEEPAEPDFLEPVLRHVEFPTSDMPPTLEFSHVERELHEKRAPILLLDWARAVMIEEWEGRAEVSRDGPFGGALALISAMHEKKSSLLLSDAAFRMEYFGDRLDAMEMPTSWLTFDSTRQRAHLLDFPFLFHHQSLVSYFRAINFSRMSRAYDESNSLQNRIMAIVANDSLVTDEHQKSVLQDLLHTASSKYFILEIGRHSVIKDAFDQLWRRQERELMRPLKIHLGEASGEEGYDSGGVQQEFFRLAIAAALDPDYGAFSVESRTRMVWFVPGSLQPEWKFELVGLLMSLAVYNGVTLPVNFPRALYRKLLGEPVTELHHISDGWPDLASGLTSLLEWDEKDGAVDDIFARTYEFSISLLGQHVSREMTSSKTPPWPQFDRYKDITSADNPEDAPLVTGDNRDAYVSDYIRYLTDVSVAPQYKAFARGFRTCLNPKSLTLLTPALLQSVVEGIQEIDIGELKRATRYVGYDASHRTIRDFWSIVKRYDDNMKRKLLEFVTASDRIPVGGLQGIQFVIQKNGEQGEGGHLPTAYTCYGTLLLPEYRDKAVLRERLAMALRNAQGFGFM